MRLALVAALWFAAVGASALDIPADLRTLLETHPPDSLAAPLRRYEGEHGRTHEGGQAALLLGHLHYARGEFRAASDDFARAAARLDPAGKPEARYWSGITWLARRDPSQALAALEEIPAESPRHADAQLAIAYAYEAGQRPERAFDTLRRMAALETGENAPAVLERLAALADALDHPEIAAGARARLVKDYPRSLEAALAAVPPPPAGEEVVGSAAVELGRFANPARARSLVELAKRSGFAGARAVERADEGHTVVYLGSYPNAGEARAAAERAGRVLGVTSRIVPAP